LWGVTGKKNPSNKRGPNSFLNKEVIVDQAKLSTQVRAFLEREKIETNGFSNGAVCQSQPNIIVGLKV
jgi:hypothetical protein